MHPMRCGATGFGRGLHNVNSFIQPVGARITRPQIFCNINWIRNPVGAIHESPADFDMISRLTRWSPVYTFPAYRFAKIHIYDYRNCR